MTYNEFLGVVSSKYKILTTLQGLHIILVNGHQLCLADCYAVGKVSNAMTDESILEYFEELVESENNLRNGLNDIMRNKDRLMESVLPRIRSKKINPDAAIPLTENLEVFMSIDTPQLITSCPLACLTELKLDTYDVYEQAIKNLDYQIQDVCDEETFDIATGVIQVRGINGYNSSSILSDYVKRVVSSAFKSNNYLGYIPARDFCFFISHDVVKGDFDKIIDTINLEVKEFPYKITNKMLHLVRDGIYEI